jgi:hypothetical protein
LLQIQARAALAALGVALAVGGCAILGEPEAEPAATPAEAPSEEVKVDGSGQRYVVRSLEKRYARRAPGDKLQTAWGIALDLEGEDAEHWHYRFYLPAEGAPAAPQPAPPAPSEPERIATPESATLRFEPFGEGLPRAGQWRDGFDLADIDGDGHLDLVHGPPRKGTRAPQIFLGDGRGGWRRWREARFPELAYDYGDARAGDLDGDGDLDLVLAVHLRGLLALLGDGRGGFERAGRGLAFEGSVLASFSSRTIRLADFDRDGHLDLLALGEGPRLAPAPAAPERGPTVVSGAQGVALFRGLGDGGFAPAGESAVAGDLFGRALALGDFDGDGLPDVAAASSQLGRTDLVQLAEPGGRRRSLSIEALRPRAYVHAVAAADFDGDGRADLAVGYASIETGDWRTGVDVLLAGAGGSWRRVAVAASEGRGGPRALATGDLDGDGAADLVALDAAGALTAFFGDRRGGFRRDRESVSALPGCRGSHLALADLDGDGRDDVVAAFAKERSAGAPEVCPGEGGLAAWRSLSR